MKYIHTETIHNTRSADQVVPLLVSLFSPSSVIDVGCGTGTWLKVFKEYGVHRLCGIDGHYVSKESIVIPIENFKGVDLEKKIDMSDQYDLLLCLEVAEHLSQERAGDFISDLCRLSNTIVFSAAIPFQGGQNHLNEQYPAYWKNLFSIYGFKCYDIIRPLVWQNIAIDWWYRQNIFVYSKSKLTPTTYNYETANVFISKDLYELKNEEIKNLNLNLINLKNNERGIKYHFFCLFRALQKRINY